MSITFMVHDTVLVKQAKFYATHDTDTGIGVKTYFAKLHELMI